MDKHRYLSLNKAAIAPVLEIIYANELHGGIDGFDLASH